MKKYGDCIITNNEGFILLLQRNKDDEFEPGVWCLPGGKVEIGETYIEGATRELFEETNIKCELEGPIHVENRKDSISSYFKGVFDENTEIILDEDEHSDSMWCAIENLSKYKLILDLGDILEEILNSNEDNILFERFKVLAGL